MVIMEESTVAFTANIVIRSCNYKVASSWKDIKTLLESGEHTIEVVDNSLASNYRPTIVIYDLPIDIT